MAQPFSPEQLCAIRSRLLESAQRHALSTGLRKTSLDALTADAGIAKSSFYKFYESKEQLFLEIAGQWEADILACAAGTLSQNAACSSKRRAAAFVFAAFERIHQLGIARFLREDLPVLSQFIPQDAARAHALSSARNIFSALRAAGIGFTAPDETVVSVVQLMYLSILNIGDIGENFFPALRELVEGACDRLVA
ncbi:MAG: TetR/AcrR family transcriptional regulator [Clostridia bacterium]|nr:TetR/AcrR family transcriptional regulator [Clostridia bacterium]